MFEVCPYGDSGNGTAVAARRSAGYSDWTGGAAACSDRSSGAFRTGGIRNWGRSELGAQSVRKNQLACLSVCMCLWPALLPFSVNRFWRNLVTRTLLWSSLAATIMVPCVIHCALVTVQSTSGCYSMSVSSQLDSGLSTSQSPVWKHIRHGCTGVSVCQGIVGTARTGTTF